MNVCVHLCFSYCRLYSYALDVAVQKELVNAASLKDRTLKINALREVKGKFEERYVLLFLCDILHKLLVIRQPTGVISVEVDEGILGSRNLKALPVWRWELSPSGASEVLPLPCRRRASMLSCFCHVVSVMASVVVVASCMLLLNVPVVALRLYMCAFAYSMIVP